MVGALLSSGGHCRLNHGTCLSVDLRDFRRARHSPRLHTDRGDCSTAPRRPDGVRHSGGGAGMRGSPPSPGTTGSLFRRAFGAFFQICGSFGSIRLHLLLAGRVKMRPGWSRLALRLLVRGGQADLGWPHQEWPGVAKLLVWFRLVPFRSISPSSAQDRGRVRGSSSHGRRVSENHDSNQLGYGVRGSCRWFGGR